MDDTIPEVLITSSNACAIYDIDNGNEMATYKNENTFSPKTLAMIGSDYLIGAYSNKPILKVWTISKQRKQELANFVVPGIVSVLAVSSCGNYCIAGIKEQIYLWEVSTGEVMNILSRHYQDITCLKFTADDSRFFSGGKDGHVMVWVLSSAIDVTMRQDTARPEMIWNKHSAEVTDIYCGVSVSRVATTSLDMTCKIFELDTGMLLSSICMDVPLTAVVMDPLEYFVYLADNRGYVYKINTYEKLPHEIHRADVNNKAALKLHDSKITSLSITFDGTRLLTVSEDNCKMWDLQSMAGLLSIRAEGTITNAFLAIIPPSLCKGVSKEEILPKLCVRTFQKSIQSSETAKKFIESSTHHKELSLMYDGCPDKHYNISLFCQTGIKPEEINLAACEESFQEAIYGESLSNVMMLNRQMFTVAVGRELGITFGDPPSPS